MASGVMGSGGLGSRGLGFRSSGFGVWRCLELSGTLRCYGF